MIHGPKRCSSVVNAPVLIIERARSLSPSKEYVPNIKPAPRLSRANSPLPAQSEWDPRFSPRMFAESPRPSSSSGTHSWQQRAASPRPSTPMSVPRPNDTQAPRETSTPDTNKGSKANENKDEVDSRSAMPFRPTEDGRRWSHSSFRRGHSPSLSTGALPPANGNHTRSPLAVGLEDEDLADSLKGLAMSPSQGRLLPERASRSPSPTKGLGGFVQSAMMKRSDSVSKRSSGTLAAAAHNALASSHPSPGNDTPNPNSRPKSAHASSISPYVSSPLGAKEVSGESDAPKRTESPSRRWSPQKASWLENAISRPESPRLSVAARSPPSWLVEDAPSKPVADLAKSSDPAANPKPEHHFPQPLMTAKSSTLSRNQSSVSDKTTATEPEFKQIFGNLKRTKTKNYEAPDELKENILRGKAGLNATGGPQKSLIRDEFKESILAKKKSMSAIAGSTLRVAKSEPNNAPEAIQRQQALRAGPRALMITEDSNLNSHPPSKPGSSVKAVAASLSDKLQGKKGEDPTSSSSMAPALCHATKSRARGPKRKPPSVVSD